MNAVLRRQFFLTLFETLHVRTIAGAVQLSFKGSSLGLETIHSPVSGKGIKRAYTNTTDHRGISIESALSPLIFMFQSRRVYTNRPGRH